MPNKRNKWRRSDLADRIGDYLSAEAILERDKGGGVVQIIERTVLRGSETNAYARPGYRLIEQDDQACRVIKHFDTLKEARAGADRYETGDGGEVRINPAVPGLDPFPIGDDDAE